MGMMRQLAKDEIAELLGTELGGAKRKGGSSEKASRKASRKARKRARLEMDLTGPGHDGDKVSARQARLAL